MKIVEFAKYGSAENLKIIEAEIPTPRENEVLVRIHASSINSWDWELLHATPFANRMMFGLTRPKRVKTLGIDIAGVVEETGAGVKDFKSGDEVYGDLSACGFGGFAEYVAAPENALDLKPANISFEQAAAIPQAGLLAWQRLMKGNIQTGMKVLINGASGGSGSFAVQIAKTYGAEVTGTCRTEKMEFVHSLGADHVIDYTKENFTRSDKKYDLIIDAQGHYSIADYKHVLNPDGSYVIHGGASSTIMPIMLLGPLLSMLGDKKISILFHKANEGLGELGELVSSGKVTPIVDKTFQLDELVDALTYYGQGKTKGKIVIKVR